MSRTRNSSEGRVIDTYSLRKAGELLGEDPKLIKGVALGMRIRLEQVGGVFLIRRRDLERIRRRLERARGEPIAC